MGKKEATYAREFHNGLTTIHHKYIDGAKIHGSRYQPKGLPDYMYYGDRDFWGSAFIGNETKYIDKLNKNKAHNLDKLLRKEQKDRLYRINEFGGIGLQSTFIKLPTGKVWLVITRPMKGCKNILPVWFAQEENITSEIMQVVNGSCIILRRKPGERRKVKDSERYPFNVCQWFGEMEGDLWIP
jgi:hypothetical protein